VESASLPAEKVTYGRLSEIHKLVAGVTGGPVLLLLGEVFAQEAAGALRKPRSATKTL